MTSPRSSKHSRSIYSSPTGSASSPGNRPEVRRPAALLEAWDWRNLYSALDRTLLTTCLGGTERGNARLGQVHKCSPTAVRCWRLHARAYDTALVRRLIANDQFDGDER